MLALTKLALAIAGVLLLASPEPRRLEVAAEQREQRLGDRRRIGLRIIEL